MEKAARDGKPPVAEKTETRREEHAGQKEPASPRGSNEQEKSAEDVKKMMQSMMKLMEGMQLMQSQILEVKKQKDVEVVKSLVGELPKLPEWRVETAPLDLTDWFLTIEPAMGDLSHGSQQWWDGMLKAARLWYAQHEEMTPLDKVNHAAETPMELKEPKYHRLQKSHGWHS